LTDLPDPIPAATLILMRPAAAAPELLVIERAAHMAFAAGALVFPGGRIDPDDHLLAGRQARGEPDAAAKIAAVRETIEETGIAPGLAPHAQAHELRKALAQGEAFSSILERHELALDLAALTPFARWCPNFRETRRFDTLFFVAEAPAGGPEATPDATEAVRILWASAADILDQIHRGEAHAIFPTRRNLERLAQFGSIEDARADAARNPVQKITPWVEEREGRRWICIPEDIGYPVTAELLETARRS
jgi:8-oxo-dGTP pyrophosphatase MutT (NUDIX family)